MMHWRSAGQAWVGQVPARPIFPQFLELTLNLALKLHTVSAHTYWRPVKHRFGSCMGNRGARCRRWCLHLEALYFRNKAAVGKNAMKITPLKQRPRAWRQPNVRGQETPGEKNALDLVKSSQSNVHWKPECSGAVHRQ